MAFWDEGAHRRGQQKHLIHSASATAANAHDSQVFKELPHGQESRVWGDSAYCGQRKVLRQYAPMAQDSTPKKGCRHHALSAEARASNRTKSKTRSKVEQLFHVMKRQFGFTKVRYRGLAKNANHLLACCALINLAVSKRRLLRAA